MVIAHHGLEVIYQYEWRQYMKSSHYKSTLKAEKEKILLINPLPTEKKDDDCKDNIIDNTNRSVNAGGFIDSDEEFENIYDFEYDNKKNNIENVKDSVIIDDHIEPNHESENINNLDINNNHIINDRKTQRKMSLDKEVKKLNDLEYDEKKNDNEKAKE